MSDAGRITNARLLSGADSGNEVDVSFIVPVFQNAQQLEHAVASIRSSTEELSAEIVIVDDGSADDTCDVAEQLNEVVVVSRPCQGGAARARNDGAVITRGRVLFFVDADVTVNADAVTGALAQIAGGADAVFGAYEPLPPPEVRNSATIFKTLLHHYTHLAGAGEAKTFWSGFGAVRRSAFFAVGGFDVSTTTTAEVEDIDLGYRLRAAGYRIVLDPSLRVNHHKRYRLRDVVRSDLLYRAVPWTRLLLAKRRPREGSHLNLSPRSVFTALLAIGIVAAAGIAPWRPAVAVGAAGVLAVAWLVLMRGTLDYARRYLTPAQTLGFTGYLFVYHVCCVLGAGLGVVAFALRHDRRSTLNWLSVDTGERRPIDVTVAVIEDSTGYDAIGGLPALEPSWELVAVGPTQPETLPAGARWIETAPETQPAERRQAALEAANGEMLAILDGGCIPAPNWLSRVSREARRTRLVVAGSFEHDRRSVRARAAQAALFWACRPERGPGPMYDHPMTNIAVRTSVAASLGGFDVEGAFLRRLASFGATPVSFDPLMRVRLTQVTTTRELLRVSRASARDVARASVEYLDLSRSHRVAEVLAAPMFVMRRLVRMVREAIAEGTADRTFWLALPLVAGAACNARIGHAAGALTRSQNNREHALDGLPIDVELDGGSATVSWSNNGAHAAIAESPPGVGGTAATSSPRR